MLPPPELSSCRPAKAKHGFVSWSKAFDCCLQELLISIEYACDEGFQASGSVKSQDLDWEEIKD